MELILRYDKPAAHTPEGWEKDSLPIGTGILVQMYTRRKQNALRIPWKCTLSK